MTVPLWTLLGFAAWTLAVLMIGVGVRRWTLIFQHRATLTGFPGDTPHGSPGYRRAMRAHANCVENLPVFAAIVLTAAIAHLDRPLMDALAIATLTGRVAQTSVHMSFVETSSTVFVRFCFFFVQIAAMLAMIGVLATAALG